MRRLFGPACVSPVSGTLKITSTVVLAFLFLLLSQDQAFAHAVTQGDKGYIQEIYGIHLIPFTYLGAKHMVTGYDHILFLFGVIFFLYRMKDIAIYVSLFALGHSVTMIAGVMFNFGINSYIIDAIIGFAEGTFPRPIPLGLRAVGWLESEINAWLDQQVENRNTPKNKTRGSV